MGLFKSKEEKQAEWVKQLYDIFVYDLEVDGREKERARFYKLTTEERMALLNAYYQKNHISLLAHALRDHFGVGTAKRIPRIMHLLDICDFSGRASTDEHSHLYYAVKSAEYHDIAIRMIESGATCADADADILYHALDNMTLFKKILSRTALSSLAQDQRCFKKICSNSGDYNEQYRLLIKGGGAPEKLEDAQDFLYATVTSGNKEVAEDLLKRGVEAHDSACFEHILAFPERLDFYQLLVDHGAKPWEMTFDGGENLLHRTAGIPDCALFPVVLSYVMTGVLDVNQKDETGLNALHIAMMNIDEPGLKNKIEQLLDAGIDIDAQDANGRTALHMAIENKYFDAVKLLIKHGAKTDIKDAKDRTAASLARKSRNKRMINLVGNINPAAVTTAAAADDGWHLLDAVSIAHIGIHPPIGKKITAIFNFEAKERLLVIDDLSPQHASSTTTRNSFEELNDASPNTLQNAFAAYQRHDGQMSEADALYASQRTGISFGMAKAGAS